MLECVLLTRGAALARACAHDKIALTTLSFRSSPCPSNPGKQPFNPSGLIEFEFTDLNDAREEAEKPSAHRCAWKNCCRAIGKNSVARSRRRTVPSPAKTIDWMLALPSNARPKALVRAVPAHRQPLGRHWNNLRDTQLVLMRLLADERGNRKGFSLQIEQEIGRLAAYVQSLLE